jgi:hypothetical protein
LGFVFPEELFIYCGFIHCIKISAHTYSHPRPDDHSYSYPHPEEKDCIINYGASSMIILLKSTHYIDTFSYFHGNNFNAASLPLNLQSQDDDHNYQS